MTTAHNTIWSGDITFSLITVPVSLVTATQSPKFSFHLIHSKDYSRLHRRMYCPKDKEFINGSQIIRGYEVEPDTYIVVEDEEIRSISPSRSNTIDIHEFVKSDQINPEFFNRPYYLLPTNSEKPYYLFTEVLEELNVVGISEFIMHNREHLVAIASIHGVLCLLMLRYPTQLYSQKEMKPEVDYNSAFVEAIDASIKDNTKGFHPEKLTDTFQKRIETLIEKKKQKYNYVEISSQKEILEEDKSVEETEEEDLVKTLEERLIKKRS